MDKDSSFVWSKHLFPFQQVGVERLTNSASLLLADEMGLGKTFQAIAAIRLLSAHAVIQNYLIVMPAGLLRQWRRQLRDWAPELKLSTVVGTATARSAAWAADATVYITSYDLLRSDLLMRSSHGPSHRRWDLVVIDEAQRIKTENSALAGAVRALKRYRSWALTGTSS